MLSNKYLLNSLNLCKNIPAQRCKTLFSKSLLIVIYTEIFYLIFEGWMGVVLIFLKIIRQLTLDLIYTSWILMMKKVLSNVNHPVNEYKDRVYLIFERWVGVIATITAFLSGMAIRVVEFSNGGYKIRKIFA